MAYKYLYIDDTKNDLEQGTINGIQYGGEITIEFKKPNDWEVQIKELQEALPGYNGIILDLRLNDTPYEDGKCAQYRGSTLAQELRTLAKEGTIKSDFPIILISANDNIEKSLDQTSYDLFDYCVSKNTLGQANGISFEQLKNQLKWLADGYQYLNKGEKKNEYILGLKDASVLDSRFIEKLNSVTEGPVHVIARFITKEIIERPSVLIDEDYLSGRLGIDKKSEDWVPFLKKCLVVHQYAGAFAGYFPRWWMFGIESFWQSEISKECNLRNTSAEKKVELIVEKTGFKKLAAIKKQERAKSDSFWVVCKATKVAIDTIDGFTISGQEDRFPWQEPEYVYMDEALRPTKPDVWKSVSAIEKPRLQKLKKLLEKHEQRPK